MWGRFLLAVAVASNAAGVLFAQNTVPTDNAPSGWRPTGEAPAAPTAPTSLSASDPGTRTAFTGRHRRQRTPNDAGQVWREYDYHSYTARVTSTKRPEQAIIDWILRDTGYEAWHTEPLSVLSAGNRTLRVYHTPEMQQIVADVVDRFVNSEAATYTFSMRVVTLDSPNWRTLDTAIVAAGAGAYFRSQCLVAAERERRHLLGELRRRNDYREHNSPYLMVNNGQSTVVSAMRGRSYIRDVAPRPDLAAGYEPSPGQVDEGFALDFSPLLSVDRQMIDAAIKCDIDQIEKMIPVLIDVPTPVGAAAADEDRIAADVALPLPRAIPLAGRSGAGGRPGHGGVADPGQRRPAGAGRAAADRQLAGPGRSAGFRGVQRLDRFRIQPGQHRPSAAARDEELPRAVLAIISSGTSRRMQRRCRIVACPGSQSRRPRARTSFLHSW